MQAEIPYLASGGLAIAVGYKNEGGWPQNGTKAVMGTIALVVIASFLGSTQAGPLVAGFGWLLFMAVAFAAITAFSK